MPKLSKQFHLEITPEQFLNACSQDEVYETWLLINSHRFRQTIIKFEEKPKKRRRTDSSGAVQIANNNQQA